MKKLNCLKILATLLPICLITLALPSVVSAAKFTLDPDSFEARKGEIFQVRVNLDTEGKKVSGVDLILEYTKDLIWIDKIEWGDIFGDEFININIKGELSLSAAKSEDDQYFQGSARLATLTLSTHGQGTANLNFVCQKDKTDDTNIIEFETSSDLINCGLLRKGIYIVHEKDWWPGKEEEEEGCGGVTLPPPTSLKAVSGSGSGEATLTWNRIAGAKFYTISYGLISGNYIYGAPNIGDTNQHVVRLLNPGKTYYFAMTAVGDCGSSSYSQEVWARAGGTPVKPTPVKPTPTIEPEVIEYIPEEPSEASPTPSPAPTITSKPTPLVEEEEEELEGKTKFPFWLKYLAIAAGVGLFLIIFVQELIRVIKKRKPPKSPPLVDEGGPKEVPAVQAEEELSQTTASVDRKKPPIEGQEEPPNGSNRTPWNKYR